MHGKWQQKRKILTSFWITVHGRIEVETNLTVGEVVFNTSLTGYQEILTDPSYAGQFVLFTCPEIGNVGINLEDMESTQAHMGAMLVRHLSLNVSNYRSAMSLPEYLE